MTYNPLGTLTSVGGVYMCGGRWEREGKGGKNRERCLLDTQCHSRAKAVQGTRLYLLHPHLSLELLVPTRPWDSGRLLQEAEVLISLRAVSPALLSVGIALACGFPGGSNDPLPSASKENQDHLYLVTDQSPSQGICRATSTPLTTPMSLCCLCPLNTKLCSPNWSFGVCGCFLTAFLASR